VLSVGAERLVMGSDCPHIIGDPARAVSSIQELEASTADRGKILGETARHIFRF